MARSALGLRGAAAGGEDSSLRTGEAAVCCEVAPSLGALPATSARPVRRRRRATGARARIQRRSGTAASQAAAQCLPASYWYTVAGHGLVVRRYYVAGRLTAGVHSRREQSRARVQHGRPLCSACTSRGPSGAGSGVPGVPGVPGDELLHCLVFQVPADRSHRACRAPPRPFFRACLVDCWLLAALTTDHTAGRLVELPSPAARRLLASRWGTATAVAP